MSHSCVFLDRDGVINAPAPPGEYIQTWEEFRLLPNAVEWIRLANALGALVIVVTNQRGVAKGLINPGELDRIHSRMVAELAAHGAQIDDIFCCPHEENACDCRKPRPGMVMAAKAKWDIDLERSVLIGDSDRDAGLAVACGLRFLRVIEGRLA